MMPFGFLGGAHFTSMSAEPIALTIGGLSSSGGASAVLEHVGPLTPHPPTKPEVCLRMRASFLTKNTVKASIMAEAKAPAETVPPFASLPY